MSEINPYEPPASELIAEPSETSVLASRNLRFWGALIDGVLGAGILIGFMWVTGTTDVFVEEDSIQSYLLSLGMGMALILLLHGVLLAQRGQTIGKVLLGTRIVSRHTEELVPLGRLILTRYFPFSALSGIPILGPFASFANVLFIFREDHLCLHDHLAGTKVILVRNPLSKSQTS